MRALAASAARSALAATRFPGGIVALDYFGDADLLALPSRRPFRALSLSRDLARPRSVAALARAALDLEWQALVYSGGLENGPGLLGRLERRGAVLGNGRREIDGVRDPSVFFEFLSREGLPHPRTWCGAGTPAFAGRTRCLWKGARSGGGARVRPAMPGETRPRGHYLQELIAGPPGSVAFVADGTRAVLLGATEQLSGFRELGGSGYRYGGNIAGPPRLLLSVGALAVLRRAASSITRQFGLRGLNGLDFVLSSGTPHPIEVNPRYTASMELLEEMSGRNFVDLHLEAITDGRLPAEPLEPWDGASGRPGSGARFLAKGILYADQRVQSVDPELLARSGCRDLPAAGEIIETGHPICTLMTDASSPSECRRILAGRAGQVRRLLRPCCEQPRVLRSLERNNSEGRPA
ncbi:MAG: hypothetical protein AUI47_04895 [Acidobacteria bacterium 13_1_40CM_2_68_5]|nr:MAG: hypothetical protein AUI47_04895 [Acidobacteria bacterium 13_1_40CM_2_68_5]